MSERRQQAVALQYALEDRAPHVVASGIGAIAQRILKIAQENNIPIKKDDDLVKILSQLKIGFEIPEETYQAVDEILAFLYRTDSLWKKRTEALGKSCSE